MHIRGTLSVRVTVVGRKPTLNIGDRRSEGDFKFHSVNVISFTFNALSVKFLGMCEFSFCLSTPYSSIFINVPLEVMARNS